MTSISTGPPILASPVGLGIEVAGCTMLVILTAVVAMRIWGRYRYKTSGRAAKSSLGESRLWVFVSDITIIISYVSAVALTAVQLNATPSVENVLHLSGLVRVLFPMCSPIWVEIMDTHLCFLTDRYKFCSAIAKMATVFLLLAISAPQMRSFNLFCKVFVVYMGLYCLACSVFAVFHVINITATIAMIFLPWWLFASITYKRKNIIACIMSALAVAETALGAVRLWSLYRVAQNSTDLTYSTSTGQVVSRLEVDFACIAACIPTMLKLIEEAWTAFRVAVLGHTSNFGGSNKSGSQTTGTHHVHLSELRSMDRSARPSGPYTSFDKDESGSMDSQDMIITKSDGKIRVNTDVMVSVGENDTVRSSFSANEHYNAEKQGKGYTVDVFTR
ncbi:hypothetical protein BX600DRAFT_499961 [Xylariales sp. PMI_506]|nr:hypothetical protein BX600DRAFT_499961 [Xylariales sp. PMI_506]